MKRSELFAVLVSILLFAAAVRCHAAVSEAILAAGARCVYVIIPSLYLFSILASFCIRTGILEAAAAPLQGICRRALHMDSTVLVILLFSQIAGYPIGAQLVRQLQEKGAVTDRQAQLMLCCCFGCGPAFLLGVFSTAAQLPESFCLLLMLAVCLPNLLLGLVLCRWEPKTRTSRISLHSTDLTASVESGAAAMLKICSMILLFAAGMGLAGTFSPLGCLAETAAELTGSSPVLVKQTASALLEISGLTACLQSGGGPAAAAALLSFGGICVHLQNAALYGEGFPWRKFLLARCACAFCSYWLCLGGMHLLPDGTALPVFRGIQPYAAVPTQEGVLPVLCLAVMVLLLLRRHFQLKPLQIKSR